jgi:hypothetical protein
MIAAHRHECVYGEAAEEYRVLGSSARKPTLSRNAFSPKRNPRSPLRDQQGRIFARSFTLSSALARKGALRAREFEDQMHIFSCLALLHNAVGAWSLDRGPHQVAVVLGRGKLAKTEVALPRWDEYQGKLLGERLREGRQLSRPRHPRCQVRFPPLRDKSRSSTTGSTGVYCNRAGRAETPASAAASSLASISFAGA